MVFYELVRRLGLLFAPDLVPLPTIDELRAQLYRDPYPKGRSNFFFERPGESYTALDGKKSKR